MELPNVLSARRFLDLVHARVDEPGCDMILIVVRPHDRTRDELFATFEDEGCVRAVLRGMLEFLCMEPEAS